MFKELAMENNKYNREDDTYLCPAATFSIV